MLFFKFQFSGFWSYLAWSLVCSGGDDVVSPVDGFSTFYVGI